jgi:chemotaxis protein methyltransferase CheR
MVELTQQDLARLRNVITRYSGLGGFLQADEALQRAVSLRLAARRLSDLSEYWALLQQPRSHEIDSLVQLILDTETFFFREMHHFELLRDRILPELLAARKFHARPQPTPEPSEHRESGPLRLWSAGCATGEEAYSLAIVLLEYEKQYGNVEAEVIGTDISARALETARSGRYGERSIRLVPANLLRQYFAFDGHTFCIKHEVGRLVRFRVHNLAERRFPPELGNMDVIFCRNVTTHFDPAARDQLDGRLAASLRDGGYLFVASTETMDHNQGQLELFPVGKALLFRKRSSEDELASALAPSPVTQATAASLTERAEHGNPGGPASDPVPGASGADPAPPEAWLYRARVAFQRQDYATVLTALEQIPTTEPALLEAYTLRAAALIHQGYLAEAETACQTILAHNPWDVDAHFMMGVIACRLGQSRAAVQPLKTAVYLEPAHRWARFYLGEAYRALDLKDNARREYRYALNILDAVHGSGEAADLNLSGIDDDALRRACEAKLAKLG